MKVWGLLSAWLGLAAAAAAGGDVLGEVLVDTRFGDVSPQSTVGLGEGVSGELPAGWCDNTEWADAGARYAAGEERGVTYHRVEVTAIDEGRVQFAWRALPDVVAGHVYRLSLEARSLTGNALKYGIRLQGEPYRFLWRTIEPLTDEWATYEHEFRLPVNGQPVGVWFVVDEVGTVDVARFSLKRFSPADIVAEVRREHPDGGPVNLFRNTRFPLGMQNGWALDRTLSDGDEVVVDVAGREAGPSGAPPLRVASDGPVRFITEPFGVVYPIVEHAVRLSVRGEGEWRFTVVRGETPVGRETVTLEVGADWRRLTIPFTPTLGVESYLLRVSGGGELLLDALQAGPSHRVGVYRTARPCEVALAVPRSDASSARVQFEDEDAVVRFCVSGERELPARLRATVTDVRGEVRALRPVTLSTGEFLSYGALSVDAFPERPFGSFRLETWVESGGRRSSPVNELVIHRLRRPRAWGRDAPDSPFGVHTYSTTRHDVMAKAIGINWVRLHDAEFEAVGWWSVEREPGAWRFRDEDVLRYREHHLKVLGQLGSAPPWASHHPDAGRGTFGYYDKYSQPKDLEAFAGYVRVVVDRYRGVIDHWDVWNEPWIHAWWNVGYEAGARGQAGYFTSEEPQQDYARLTRVARDAARSVNPDAVVLGFNSTTGGGGDHSFSGRDWTEGVLESDGLEHCDAVCYHCYVFKATPLGFPGDHVQRGLGSAMGPILERHGEIPVPVWMTEGSPVTYQTNNGLYRHTLPYASDDPGVVSSDRLARYMLSLLANGVDKLFLYSMHAHGSSYSVEPRQWGVLTTDEGALHPTGAAHSAFAWHVEGTTFVERLDLGGGVFASLFEGDGRAVAVLSGEPAAEPFPIPCADGLAAADLFGNPLPEGAAYADTIVYLASDAGGAALAEVLRAQVAATGRVARHAEAETR